MFSVIVPLYNKELSILNTINSVLSQSVSDFEIIVVNDGSTDNSLNVVKSIDDSRVKIIEKNNEGVSTARNRGIGEARFDWIAFLDGDDIWHRNHLSVVLDMINEFPSVKLFATSFDYSDARSVRRIQHEGSTRLIENYFKDSLEEHLIWTSIFVGHKSCFEDNLFNKNLALGEDLELWGRLVKRYSFVKSSIVTATYRVDAENRSFKRKYNLDRSFLLTLDFKKMSSSYEKQYYRRYVGQIFKNAVVNRDWIVVLRLIGRFHFVLIQALIE